MHLRTLSFHRFEMRKHQESETVIMAGPPTPPNLPPPPEIRLYDQCLLAIGFPQEDLIKSLFLGGGGVD